MDLSLKDRSLGSNPNQNPNPSPSPSPSPGPSPSPRLSPNPNPNPTPNPNQDLSLAALSLGELEEARRRELEDATALPSPIATEPPSQRSRAEAPSWRRRSLLAAPAAWDAGASGLGRSTHSGRAPLPPPRRPQWQHMVLPSASGRAAHPALLPAFHQAGRIPPRPLSGRPPRGPRRVQGQGLSHATVPRPLPPASRPPQRAVVRL